MAIAPELLRAFLRDMRREDLPAVLDIERRSFAQPWSRAFLREGAGDPFARLVVAVEEAVPRPQVIGYTCRWRVTDEVHLLNVAVHPSGRGLGHGRVLSGRWWRRPTRRGTRVVYLEVRAGNVIARRLYRQLGFRDLGVRPRLLRPRPGRDRDGAAAGRPVSAGAGVDTSVAVGAVRPAEPRHRGFRHLRLRDRVRRAGRPGRRSVRSP